MKQNFVSQWIFQGKSINKDYVSLVKKIEKLTGFKSKETVNKSAWWSSKKIGAIHLKGSFQNKNAVLKIELIKPTISEFENIKNFEKQNKSKIIRLPKIYYFLPWNDDNQFEVLIMEDVGKNKLVKIPTNEKNIDDFFKVIKEYKKNCLRKPWLEKPTSTSMLIKTHFNKWLKIRKMLYSNHPYIKKEDLDLINQAIKILVKNYQNIPLEFVHGHLGDSDFYKVGNEVVILSNLYWSWRPPFYDVVFCYHWFIYHLANLKITKNKVLEQKNLWLKAIYNFDKDNKKLINLALLERAAAGLNLDALSIDPKNPLSEFMLEITREEVKRLINLF